jgi:hypothetical protein
VQQIAKVLAMLLIVGLTLPGCSSFSKQARMERAHRKYVRKVRHEQGKQASKAAEEANRPLREAPSMSAPVTNVTLGPLPFEDVPAPVMVNDNTEPMP